ncbi:acetylcholinesterase-like [Limulus polyphemus]|uniref:Carboxylic ester hydrolase n=1 Tax=Limulus polyphemus TaxID=6850 RepID=A0ABM1TPI6_LIMPO|nr:acetylcholinesterase-like [Limulus polyphemus]
MIGTTSIILYFILHLELITAINLEKDGSESPVINTESGLVRGLTTNTANGKTVDVFWGIPYAEPPTGHLRFQRPQHKEPWEGVLNATTKPNSCVQINHVPPENFSGDTSWFIKTPLSEDCLYLNIWVPHPQPQNAPVMVWIHGGGFTSGSSTLDIYDGEILSSEENVIVVSINYRVGSLGFLYFNRSDAPGNVGLFDQLMALEWINKNIVYFGGDSGKVTIFGESAGASSVSLHLLSPLSQGLFNNAIMESGSILNSWSLHDREVLIHPLIDGSEGSLFLFYEFPEIFKKEEEVGVTRKEFHRLVEKVVHDTNNFQRKAIVFQYTDWLEEDNIYRNRDMLIDLVGDKFITCDTNEFAHKYAQRGNDVFMYYFTHTPSVSSWPRWMGTTHGDEISFVFGAPLNSLLDYSTEEQELARRIMKHWTNFARTG